jgi:hypothetical protein
MDTNTVKTRGMGWLLDLPDFRDCTPEHVKIALIRVQMNLETVYDLTFKPLSKSRVVQGRIFK